MRTKDLVRLLRAFGVITLLGFVVAALGGTAIEVVLMVTGGINIAAVLVIWAVQL